MENVQQKAMKKLPSDIWHPLLLPILNLQRGGESWASEKNGTMCRLYVPLGDIFKDLQRISRNVYKNKEDWFTWDGLLPQNSSKATQFDSNQGSERHFCAF